MTVHRIYCFSHAGGGAAAFRPWMAISPGNLQVVPVSLPGREDRIRAPQHFVMESLIEELEDQLVSTIDGSFAFLGHSMGALVAFELTRSLMRMGKQLPRALFVSAARAPHVRDNRRALHRLRRAELVAALRALEGTPGAILDDPEAVALYLPRIRADLAVCETYRDGGGSPLSCPIVAFAGQADPHVSPHEMTRWGECSRAGFRLRTFVGGHFFIHQQAGSVLRYVAEVLGSLEPRRMREGEEERV